MNASSTKVTVVIPNWNGLKWLPGCLEALTAQTFKGAHVIVVDNASADGSQEFIEKEYPDVALIRMSENTGFAAAVNTGIEASNSEYIVLLNNDTIPRPEWLGSLMKAIENAPPEIGSLASRMLDMKDPAVIDSAGDLLTRQGAAQKRGHGYPANHYTGADEVFSPCGGAALYRRSLFEKIGGFDEHFFAYLEDVDVGLRSRLYGYGTLYVPNAEVLHRGHGSGLRKGRYVRLVTRNRMLLLFKNLPAQVLWKNLHHLLYGQIYFCIAYRHPVDAIAGCFDFLRLLPYARRARKHNLGATKLSWRDIDALLEPEMGEPPLLHTIWKRIRGRSR